MRKFAFRRWPMVVFAFALIMAISGSALAAELVLLHTNDMHGRLDASETGGLTRVAAVVSQLRSEYPGQVLLVDAGDAIHGTNIANIFGGASVVEAKNAMEYRISTLGNHEFNYGQETLKERMADYNHPVLASNVVDLVNKRPFGYTSTILTVNGIKIGVFGLVAQETPIVTHPKNVDGLLFQDPIARASQIVPGLRKQVDLVVAVNHIGLDVDKELATAVPGIDVIISGHSHDRLDQPVQIGSTIIASAHEHTTNLGYIKLNVESGTITEWEGNLIPITADTPVDPKVSAIVATWNAKLQDRLEQVVGTTAVSLDGERNDVRSRETNLGNLVTDAMRDYLATDVAINNGGGIRASIPSGEITMADIYTVLPFDNTVVSLQVSGAQLLECLERGVESYPETAGSFLQVSGVTFDFDPTRPVGEKVTAAFVGGAPLDPDGLYSLATNDFMAAGGDGYTALASAKRLVDTGEMLRDIVATYIAGTDIAPQVEDRISAK